MTAQEKPARGVPAAPSGVSETELASLEGVPWLTRMALRIAARLKKGSLTVELPDGRRLHFKGAQPGREAVLVIRDHAFAKHIFTGGDLGAAEAYLRGFWESPNIEAFLELFATNRQALMDSRSGMKVARFFARLGHLLRHNNRANAKRNIEQHYDLGNKFYTRWLDQTMTYSSAKFDNPNDDLSAAQLNKYRSLARRIDLKPDHHILEIGSGWGGFAEFAATEIGCRVTGVTISREQLEFARARMARQGLQDRVEIRYQDYRDISETYDRIASIEMFEAVGERYWPAYFGKVRDCLKPGGLAGLQIITIDDKSFPAYRKSVDFIQHYIFPGGMLPSIKALQEEVKRAGLDWKDNLNFGLDYAETLARWRHRFMEAWPDIQPLGFDDRFKRMWEYYLAYCEAGFRTGNIDVTQLTIAKS
ncbi:class I SAM-dependent methyltransferase [Tepidicaulis sp. LMO-SS28]|uniref:class I SAM-dependent methyltransferase n=1 Tax=Tepidicaulis sp. LMO-SS28 TaxID=3447455 RepID=UPI003EE059E5